MVAEYNFGDSEVVMAAWAIMALPFVVEARVRSRGSPDSAVLDS